LFLKADRRASGAWKIGPCGSLCREGFEPDATSDPVAGPRNIRLRSVGYRKNILNRRSSRKMQDRGTKAALAFA
jgi:hypothetical protein